MAQTIQIIMEGMEKNASNKTIQISLQGKAINKIYLKNKIIKEGLIKKEM
jgi:hypothetical protein